MINVIKGNLLDSDCDYICHQVNCMGKMNSGVAKAIREKWPVVFEEYQKAYNFAEDCSINDKSCQSTIADYLLGESQFVNINDSQQVVNMFAQNGYGYDGKRYTSYDAFWSCLGKIKSKVPKGSKIAFPYNIGCCRGGANWEVIYAMIVAVLNDDYDIYFYRLEE